MNDGPLSRPTPVVLPNGGVVVPAELCSILAAILDGLIEQAARPAPVGVQQPAVPAALLAIAGAARTAAVEHEARRHRDFAQARLAILAGEFSPDLSLIPRVLPLVEGEIGTTQVAEILEISPQRVRQLVAAGQLPARRAPHRALAFRSADVATFMKGRGRDGGYGEPESGGSAA